MVITELLTKFEQSRDSLIPILQEAQKSCGYLSKQSIHDISGYLGISENDIYGVATFYTQFRFKPKAVHEVKVCEGTACHVRGSKRIKSEVIEILGINPGESTEDNKFSLTSVACFGSCALSPVILIDGKVYGRVTPKKVRQLLKEIK